MDSVPTGLSEPAGLVNPAAPGLGLLEPGPPNVAVPDSLMSPTSPAETPSVIRDIRGDSILGTEALSHPENLAQSMMLCLQLLP